MKDIGRILHIGLIPFSDFSDQVGIFLGTAIYYSIETNNLMLLNQKFNPAFYHTSTSYAIPVTVSTRGQPHLDVKNLSLPKYETAHI